MTAMQLLMIAFITGAGLTGAWSMPVLTLLVADVLLAVIFLATIALRLWAALPESRPSRGRAALRPLPDHALPAYTILVPLFREADVLPRLARSLLAIDYPAVKLDIKLVFEAEDLATQAAARGLGLHNRFEFVVCPPGGPQTKPRALNFALQTARGAFVVIYDAEDRPEPDQLRKAVQAFRRLPRNVACLQAHLSFDNVSENWLTRQFTIEYAGHFDVLMPAMTRIGLPLPLGGTSNHFRTGILRAVFGWDPHNVTEDADLGIRLARLGYRTAMLDSTTYEEASCRFGNWLGQRTRWFKGWLQTLLVHFRRPRRLVRDVGFVGAFGVFAVIGGGLLSALVHPLFTALIVALPLLGYRLLDPQDWLGAMLVGLNVIVLMTGYAAVVAIGAVGIRRRRLNGLWPAVAGVPVYWLMISVAAWRALWEFAWRPFHWYKTTHGESRLLATDGHVYPADINGAAGARRPR